MQFLNPLRSEKIGKNAAAYAAEQLVLQETFEISKSADYKRAGLQNESNLKWSAHGI